MHRHALFLPICLLFLASMLGADETEVLRSRVLQAKPQAIRAVTTIGETLPLRLFDDVRFNARLVSLEDDSFNGFVWRGVLEDTPGGWVVMVEDKGCLAGTVATRETYYRILCLGNGLHLIDEVRPPESFADDTMADQPEPSEELEILADASPALEPDEIVEMDALVVYTRKAARKLFREFETGYAGKKKAMQAYIKLAVAIANTAFENSDVKIRLRLVKIRPIKYRATGESSVDLRNLRYEDGVIDEVHQWREQYGADFVSMILDDFEPEYVGRAYLAPPGPGAAERMFSVVVYDALWWTTFAHEIGHNMGLAHDKDNDSLPPSYRSYRYSRGYRDPTAGFRTIMAYRDGCDRCRWRIPHFSNKEVLWEGAPTGNPNSTLSCGDGVTTGPRCGRKTGSNKANCGKSLNNTRDFYAAVHPCRVDCDN